MYCEACKIEFMDTHCPYCGISQENIREKQLKQLEELNSVEMLDFNCITIGNRRLYKNANGKPLFKTTLEPLYERHLLVKIFACLDTLSTNVNNISEKLNRLENNLSELRDEIKYLPGGEEMKNAEEHFYQNVDN